MPGDSGSSPDAGSISNYCLTQEIYHSNPSGLLSFNKSAKVLWTIAKYIIIIIIIIIIREPKTLLSEYIYCGHHHISKDVHVHYEVE